MQDFTKLIEIVTVNYNTPDLIKNLLKSIRTFIGNDYQFTVIDGSDEMRYSQIADLKDKNTRIIHFDYNIHHGPGMHYAITNSKHEYILLLDSDSEIIKYGLLDRMFSAFKSTTYCVAQIVFVNGSGRNEHNGKYAYAHPHCMLIKKSEYIKYAPFIMHGAPCIEAMIDIHQNKKVSSLVGFPELRSYVVEDHSKSTVRKYGYNIDSPFSIPRIISVGGGTFNILLRTSNRPNYFKNCYKSILNQTYKNVNIIVNVDDDASFRYVKRCNANYIVKAQRAPVELKLQFDNAIGRTRRYAPYNLYFNSMYKYLVNGYIIYLDDDDQFADENSLMTIRNSILSDDNMLFWRVRFPSGRIVPNDTGWGSKPICCNISGIGYSFHTKYKDHAIWDEWTLCDYKVANQLYQKISKKIFINQVLTKVQRNKTGGLGRRDDL